MKHFVKFEVFETITNNEEVKRVREAAGKQLQQIQSSGKLVEGGMFGDARGGFLVFDLEGPSDLYELLGNAIFDNCRIESHPIVSFKELGEFFKKHPVE